MSYLLRNATLIAPDREKPALKGWDLLIDGPQIAAIGKKIAGSESGALTINCAGAIVMPGLVNAHCHLLEVLQRGFRDNVRMEIWREYRMATEELARLGPREVELAAQLACAEMLKSGVTAVVDHFSTRAPVDLEKARATLRAFERTGIRGALAPALRDRDAIALLDGKAAQAAGAARPGNWRANFLALLEEARTRWPEAVLMLGPSNPLNCSDALLAEISRLSESHGFAVHTHLLETRLQRWAAARLYPKGLLPHLDDLGLLSPRLSAAHGVWLDSDGIEILARSGASMVHNPASNLKLGSGRAPVSELRRRGVNVALGTDGGDTSDSYSIFHQMRLAALLSRLDEEKPERWVTAREALRMATIGGAEAVPAWRGKVGRLKPGFRADLVILRPRLPLQPLNDCIHQLVFCDWSAFVDTVFVNGRIVVRGGKLTGLDEEALIAEVAPLSARMHRLYLRVKARANETVSRIERLYARAVARNGAKSLRRGSLDRLRTRD